MSLLRDIQVSLLDENANIGPVLLKLRFLADRLGSDILEDWVKHETEGYEASSGLPSYRQTTITYTGTFSNGYQTLNDVSIAPSLIVKHANKEWVQYGIRDPLPVIEKLTMNSSSEGGFSVDTGNLKLLIQDKIYDNGMVCLELTSRIDIGAFAQILTDVRAKLLDFTLEIEKKVPVSKLITVDVSAEVSSTDIANVAQITHNVFNGPVGSIASIGSPSNVDVEVNFGTVGVTVNVLAFNMCIHHRPT